MFRHILVPTDGSDLSRKAIAGAIDLAQAVGARITAYACLPQYPYAPFSEIAVEPPSEFLNRSEREAQEHLREVEFAASRVGVVVDRRTSVHPAPYLGIIEAAEAWWLRCDLHGVTRAARSRQPADRQRNAARAHAHENSRAGVSLKSRIPALIVVAIAVVIAVVIADSGERAGAWAGVVHSPHNPVMPGCAGFMQPPPYRQLSGAAHKNRRCAVRSSSRRRRPAGATAAPPVRCLSAFHFCDQVARPLRDFLVEELLVFRRAVQRRRRCFALDRLRDRVEIAGAHFALMLDGGEALFRGGEFGLLHLDERASSDCARSRARG